MNIGHILALITAFVAVFGLFATILIETTRDLENRIDRLQMQIRTEVNELKKDVDARFERMTNRQTAIRELLVTGTNDFSRRLTRLESFVEMSGPAHGSFRAAQEEGLQ